MVFAKHLLPVALFAFALLCPLLASAQGKAQDGTEATAIEGLHQSVSADLEQEAWGRGVRADGPVNEGDWMSLPAWAFYFQADSEFLVETGKNVRLALSPRVTWYEEEEGVPKDATVEVYRAEASLELPDWGIRALCGKMRPQFGSDYIEPLSVINVRGRDRYDEGQWMGGLSFAWRDLDLEAYCEAASDPAVIGAAQLLVGDAELGLLYRRDSWNSFGAWCRGQIGDEFIPYAELMVRDDSAFLDIAGLPARAKGWNADLLGGLGFTPYALNVSFYIEYRYRQCGYTDEDWRSISAAGKAAQAVLLPDLPYLQTAVHTLGLYARNTSEIAEWLSWTALAAYLYPDGIYGAGSVSARLIEQCSVELGGELIETLGRGRARSEMAIWPYDWSCSLTLRWAFKAKE